MAKSPVEDRGTLLGLAPGAIYAAAAHVAPSPQAVPPTIGLVQQASNLGQFAGPVVLGLWVEHLG